MRRYTFRIGAIEVGMLTAALVFIVPVYILLNLSVRGLDDLSSPLLPTQTPTFANFERAWVEGRLGWALINSAAVTGLSVVLLIVISALAAYPLARVTSRWSRGSYIFIIVGLLIPIQLGFIPLYRVFLSLHMLGSIWPLVIFYAGLQVPFSVFLYSAFIRALPRDYEEAAALDGCSPLQAFRSVVFPLLSPVTASVAIINVIVIWNDFMTPLLYLSGARQQTVPVAVFGFVGQYTSQWSVVFAALVIGMGPVLVVFFALQGRVMKGFSAGVKG